MVSIQSTRNRGCSSSSHCDSPCKAFLGLKMVAGSLAISLAAGAAHAATAYQWSSSASLLTGGTYNWNNSPTVWSPNTSYPGATIGDTANTTNQNITGDTTININAALTLAGLTVGDKTRSNIWNVALTTGGSLIFNGNGSDAVLAQAGASNGDTISADFTLASNLQLSNNQASRVFTINGAIGGTGNLILPSTNVGIVVLGNASNGYAGNTTISGGSLQVSGTIGSLGATSGTRTITLDGGTLLNRSNTLNFSTSNKVLAVTANGGTINLGSKALTLGASQFTGNGALSVANGAFTVGGANSYSGTITTTGTVNLNAALAVAGDLSIGAAGKVALGSTGTFGSTKSIISTDSTGVFDTTAKTTAFTISSGQTIGGAGSWNTGTLSNTVNGTLRVGATHGATSAGTFTVANGTATVALGGTTQIDLIDDAGGADQLKFTGTGGLTYGGFLDVAATSTASAGFSIGDVWNVVALASGQTFTGQFSNLATDNSGGDGHLPALASGSAWHFDPSTGALSIVPEPTSLALLAGGFFMIGRRRRKN